MYNQQSIYIYAYKCLCQCVGKYTTQMSTVVSLICLGPSFQKMTHHFLLHGSLSPTNLEKKNLMPLMNASSNNNYHFFLCLCASRLVESVFLVLRAEVVHPFVYIHLLSKYE